MVDHAENQENQENQLKKKVKIPEALRGQMVNRLNEIYSLDWDYLSLIDLAASFAKLADEDIVHGLLDLAQEAMGCACILCTLEFSCYKGEILHRLKKAKNGG